MSHTPLIIPDGKISKQQVADEIRNFIEYAYSDDADRQRMFNVLEDYMNEVYTETPMQ